GVACFWTLMKQTWKQPDRYCSSCWARWKRWTAHCGPIRMAPIFMPEKKAIRAPLWLLVLVTLSGTLAMHMFVPAMPDAAADLGASMSAMQMTISLYILGLAFGQLVYGPLSDGFG